MVDTIRQVEKFGVFRVNESFEDIEFEHAMAAVWGTVPRAKELSEDIRRLPDIELVPRNQLRDDSASEPETFVDRAIEYIKGKGNAEA